MDADSALRAQPRTSHSLLWHDGREFRAVGDARMRAGMKAVSSARTSLEELAIQYLRFRGNVHLRGRAPADALYMLYSATRQEHIDSSAYLEFLGESLRCAQRYDVVPLFQLQDEVRKLPEALRSIEAHGIPGVEGFVHFVKFGNPAQSRVSLNVPTERLMDITERLAALIDQEGSPMRAFKVQCPVDDGRKDVVVIYLDTDSVAVARALATGLTAEFRLNPETPAGMQRLSPGVGFAHDKEGTSHGAVRCACIAEAVEALDSHTRLFETTVEEAGQLLLDRFLPAALERAGVDPLLPHKYVG